MATAGTRQNSARLKKVGDMRMRENIKPSGTTAQRPTLTTADVGFMYFDTTTQAAVWWTGTQWSDQ